MEILEKPLKEIPGLVLVFGLLALLMAEDHSEIAIAIRVFVVAWILYRVGSFLDFPFDWLYHPESYNPSAVGVRTWKKHLPGFAELEESRRAAAREMKRGTTEGIYNKAKDAVTKEKWEATVAFPLKISKLARTLVIPLLVAMIMTNGIPQGLWARLRELGEQRVMHPFAEDFDLAHKKLSLLYSFDPCGFPVVVVALLLFSLYICFAYRIEHMLKLYQLVVPTPANAQPDGPEPRRSSS